MDSQEFDGWLEALTEHRQFRKQHSAQVQNRVSTPDIPPDVQRPNENLLPKFGYLSISSTSATPIPSPPEAAANAVNPDHAVPDAGKSKKRSVLFLKMYVN